jgi:cyclophilin family peptidyl-prolyl cis-trans isomerase
MKLFKVFFVAAILLAASCKPAKYADLEKGLYADIETTSGDILCKLYFEDTPLTIANFVSLAEGTNPNVSDSLKGRKFYDGLTFHRVMKDFMIQGGDPLANGTGGPGYKFEDEFPKDSLGKFKYSHSRDGVLSMANGGPGTNGSQFFITHKATPWLDGVHTVFGKVEYGQEVVDSIEVGAVINHIRFIKIGHKAKGFDAAKVFTEELKNSIVAKQQRIDDGIKAEEVRYKKYLEDCKVFQAKQGIAKAKKTESGLQILTLKKGKGKKFSETKETTINYTISLASGKQIQTTVGRDPFSFTMIKQPMIAGVKEAILKMREGGKARLFIPYYLGYGERKYGPFPAKSDVVFELEILKVGK